MKANIGLIGLAVMGQNLALNIARKGYTVAVFNRTSKRTENLMQRVKDEKIIPTYDLKELVESLEKPRKIILMVKAGDPVDQMIDHLLPYLEEEDLIIDGGNSHYMDTSRRIKQLSEKGILFLGMGVSGGEYGALHGPSLMLGGSKKAYEMMEEILLKIAAKSDEGPCCTYIGDNSAGHFVKMVHNGIEYAIMQSIAEVYDIMRKVLKMNTEEIGDVFEKWNEGDLSSFLVEITYKIMHKKDEETGEPLVNLILDKAEQKGTG
ncbi:MAG: NADP-dependent phosphogluconate dehydrogenase, partial [Candidatus Hodarchaeales archaeon]